VNRGARTPARARGAALLGGVLGVAVLHAAQAGHESPFYPSFYPQEIRIETLDAGAARAGWNKARVHVYVGADPFAGGAPPADATALQRLHGFLVLTFDGSPGPREPASGAKQDHCARAGRILGELAPGAADFVVHPYPVTPYHADYLQHFDLAQEARARLAGAAADGAAVAPLRIRAKGKFAQTLIPARWKAPASGWDATLEEIDLDRLAAADGSAFGGWSGPPWAKQGWYHAYRLLGDQPQESAARKLADRTGERLVTGDYREPVERINLERALVSTLVAGCGRMVVGYRVARERFNSEYFVGVENLAFDSQSGFESPVFPRTVKLKDFMWNGWLRLGIKGKPSAAWNPVGGMNDGFGRMLWLAVGDPALLPPPHGGHWIPNRVSIGAKAGAGAVAIPRDAVVPQPGTGLLQPVGPGKTAQQHVRYFVTLSLFHHGISTSVADIVYPYIFAFRWGAAGAGEGAADPSVARSTALVRQWLAGFKVVRVEEQVRNYGEDLKFSYQVPVDARGSGAARAQARHALERARRGGVNRAALVHGSVGSHRAHGGSRAARHRGVHRGRGEASPNTMARPCPRPGIGQAPRRLGRDLQPRRVPARSAERAGHRGRSAGTLEGARPLPRGAWPLPGHERSLPAEVVERRHRRAGGVPGPELPRGLGDVRRSGDPAQGARHEGRFPGHPARAAGRGGARLQVSAQLQDRAHRAGPRVTGC
jgi:hypothetical protein